MHWQLNKEENFEIRTFQHVTLKYSDPYDLSISGTFNRFQLCPVK